LAWWWTGHPSAITFTKTNLLPELNNPNHWVSLVAIMASFVGMELSGVHIKDMDNPQKNFPKAVFISSFFIFATMLLGSLAIAIVVPKEDISLVSGVMQVFHNFFSYFNLAALTPLAALLIVLGSTGGIINWVLSPAKGLVEAAELGYLPKHFLKKNEHGAAYPILILQAIVVTVLCALFMFISSINSFYWFLTALSTELYMFMYVLMFLAAYKLRNVKETGRKTFVIPGKNLVRMGVVTIGLCGCLITIFISFFPPETLKVDSLLSYVMWIGLGNMATLSPLALFFYHCFSPVLF
jgi:amino acid transporter